MKRRARLVPSGDRRGFRSSFAGNDPRHSWRRFHSLPETWNGCGMTKHASLFGMRSIKPGRFHRLGLIGRFAYASDDMASVTWFNSFGRGKSVHLRAGTQQAWIANALAWEQITAVGSRQDVGTKLTKPSPSHGVFKSMLCVSCVPRVRPKRVAGSI